MNDVLKDKLPTYQSIVQQLIREGNCRSLSLKASPIGLKHKARCRLDLVLSRKKLQSS
jgi:hypothetical protein